MLELHATSFSVVQIFADPSALDAVSDIHRVAPDEAMMVGDPAVAPAVHVEDPDAVVIDASDGWAVFTLVGDQAHEGFALLSALELPVEGYTQGDVAHLPVRVIVEHDRLHLLVAAMWGTHLRGRILDRCASIDIREVDPS